MTHTDTLEEKLKKSIDKTKIFWYTLDIVKEVTKEIYTMKIVVILVATFMGFRTLYPAIACTEEGEYGKAFGYVLEFASLVFLLYNFGGLK